MTTTSTVLGRIADQATAEADSAFEAFFATDPNDRTVARAAHADLETAYETLRLALLTAGHDKVADLSGALVHGYAELNGPFA